MSEYIDREQLYMNILGLTIVDPSVAAYANAVLSRIAAATAADVEPVSHGRWVGFYHDTCCKCGWAVSEHLDFNVGWKYGDFAKSLSRCPNCGAKMDMKS